ncbi:hypothetical protein BB934_10980 [Microvirga ossetica]|uniref:TNase-like domain-containing protein n=1 Tax=Microvirga ossetica TaxID=1882682 RepID=A0A1B2EFC8_9HYPH|nr:hypothetical protein [Microvirga ossetica]ANY78684.1 hypothetical protein BB934_10980 [Microvirga ossetica]
MNDDSITRDSPADPRHHWAHMRERMREIIRAELDRIHPTDDAYRALELIIESSVRPSEVDGALKLTIIDHDGKPRTKRLDGEDVEFTLHDLLDELRVRYPVLFRPGKRDAEQAGADGPIEPREKPKRDWLALDPGTKSDAAASPELDKPAPLAHIRDEAPELRAHQHDALAASDAPTLPQGSADPMPEEAIPIVAEHQRQVFGDMRKRSWARPSLALGAVAVVALLGVGAFMFRGDDAAPSQASTTPPPASNLAAAGPIREPEPSVTGSTASSAALRGVPDVIDTATLSLNGEVVRLFGVEWAPGAGKPEDLTQYLNGREVACEPAGSNDVYRCQVGGQDLSRVVLFNGGGRPTGDATPELKAAADKARAAKLGVWGQSQ